MENTEISIVPDNTSEFAYIFFWTDLYIELQIWKFGWFHQKQRLRHWNILHQSH